MKLCDANPFLRNTMRQSVLLEGRGPRKAYDHRIFLIVDGSGTAFIGGSQYPIGVNSLMIFRPGVAYYFRGKMKALVVNYDVTRSASVRPNAITPPDADRFDPALIFDEEFIDCFASPVVTTASDEVRRLLNELVDEYNLGRTEERDTLLSAGIKRALALVRMSMASRVDPPTELANRVMAIVKSDPTSISCNADIAGILGYHPVYLAGLFRHVTGKNLHAFIVDEKLAVACKFLERTDCSIESVAFDAGFSSRNHFCTLFKKKFGKAPGAYRRSLRGSEEKTRSSFDREKFTQNSEK